MTKILCESCEKCALQRIDETEDCPGGWMCPSYESYEPGTGCNKLISPEDYEELAAEADGAAKKAKTDIASEDTSKTKKFVRPPVVVPPNQLTVKNANVEGILSDNLVIRRKPLLPSILTVSEGAAVIRRPFQSPCPGVQGHSAELLRRLSARRLFVPWLLACKGPSMSLPLPMPPAAPEIPQEELAPDIEPLVLWDPADGGPVPTGVKVTEKSRPVVVDPCLVKFLREHQREGVQFMFECVTGLREFCDWKPPEKPKKKGAAAAQEPEAPADASTDVPENEPRYLGCILADDMGLGKTLQGVSLMWTLMRNGFDGSPVAKRVIIVTPTSLVSNWESEIHKWIPGRASPIALCESSRADVIKGITRFLGHSNQGQILIISYETFRLHAERFKAKGACDLLICDEAHRLKNEATLTTQALSMLSCRRRVLLSGTPMQNDLDEFYAMVSFTNPGILGDQAAFRRYYEAPILTGREPEATDDERRKADERAAELSTRVNQFILRRTNELLSKHLPPKLVQVVCCRLSPLQKQLYTHFLKSTTVKAAVANAKPSKVLASITAMKKLCNHPKLIYDMIRSGAASQAAGFEDCAQFFPEGMFERHRGAAPFSMVDACHLSGKMAVLGRMLDILRRETRDRIVLVSNYTQTLDLFTAFCRERGYPFLRLDGTTSVGKRQKLVKAFNDMTQDQFAFLLSSKAGGCGLNLIGGNRLVLFDPDWNPAADKQAAARVWRDGQKKRTYLYRFLATGTIEEKVYQRQLAKEGLQSVVNSACAANDDGSDELKMQVNMMSTEELKKLFEFKDVEGSGCDTHETYSCKRCPAPKPKPAEGTAGEPGGAPRSPLPGGITPPPSKAAFKAPRTTPSPQRKEDGTAVGDGVDAVDIGGFQEVAKVKHLLQPHQKQVASPTEEDLKNWAHHETAATVPDSVMQRAAMDDVSFIFSCQIHGQLTPQEDDGPAPTAAARGTARTLGALAGSATVAVAGSAPANVPAGAASGAMSGAASGATSATARQNPVARALLSPRLAPMGSGANAFRRPGLSGSPSLPAGDAAGGKGQPGSVPASAAARTDAEKISAGNIASPQGAAATARPPVHPSRSPLASISNYVPQEPRQQTKAKELAGKNTVAEVGIKPAVTGTKALGDGCMDLTVEDSGGASPQATDKPAKEKKGSLLSLSLSQKKSLLQKKASSWETDENDNQFED
eukprot:jgi/Mesvir1/17155/Mv07580-RA.1